MSIIAVSGEVSARDAALIKSVVAGIVPELRSYFEEQFAPLKEENEALRARVKQLEDRPAPEIDLKPVEKLIEAEIAKLPTPEPAKEFDRDELAEAISLAVEAAVATLPPPEKGEKGEKGDAGERGADGKDGRDGSDGKDGAGIIDGFVSRGGHLIATLSDGTTRDFGEIVGKDGKDGEPGKDGFGFDDMDACVLDDDRTIELRFRRGDEEKCFTFKWPTAIYRGVYSEGTDYAAGDMVTWGGSLWHCDTATQAKPGTEDWTLAAKKGRDGKNG